LELFSLSWFKTIISIRKTQLSGGYDIFSLLTIPAMSNTGMTISPQNLINNCPSQTTTKVTGLTKLFKFFFFHYNTPEQSQ
jgi:hypothetical protein